MIDTRRTLLHEIGEALTALTCPYLNGEGTCHDNCYSEPRCQTDAPIDGWEAQIVRCATELASTQGCGPDEKDQFPNHKPERGQQA